MKTRFLIALILLVCPLLKAEATPLAIATWVETEQNAFQIVASQLLEAENGDEPQWQAPAVLHRSENAMTSSNLVALASGEQLLFWAEAIKSKSSIWYKSRANQASDWSEPLPLYRKGSENIGASALRVGDQLWLFWASSDEGLPDIKYMIRDSGWSKPQSVHAPNDVPDLHPSATLSPNGEVQLSWLTYSFLQSDYVNARKEIESSLDTPVPVDIIDVDKFTVPSFLPSGRAVTIRFPKNSQHQSLKVAAAHSP